MLNHYDLAEIQSLRLDWVRAMNAGNVTRLGSLFTPTAIWIPDNEPALEGWSAISAWLGTIFESYRYQISVSDPEVRFARNWAVEKARFTARLSPLDGTEASTYNSGYIIIWHRGIDELWAIDRYIND
ncbi:MAG: nuclear transport factor 2 family protein [Dehalococcoidia bacterium]